LIPPEPTHIFLSRAAGSLDSLSQLTALEYLFLNLNRLSGNLSGVSSLTRLTVLSLDSAGTLVGSLDPLASLTALQYLNVAGMCFHFGALGLVRQGPGQDHRDLFVFARLVWSILFCVQLLFEFQAMHSRAVLLLWAI
jgi:hypothetical protein